MLSENSLLNLVTRMQKRLEIKNTKMCTPAYRIAAAGFTKRGNLLGIMVNSWRDLKTIRRGTGRHAEAALMKRFGQKLDTIYILRVGKVGDILPIHPCESCSKMAKKIGIKIIPLHQILNFF